MWLDIVGLLLLAYITHTHTVNTTRQRAAMWMAVSFFPSCHIFYIIFKASIKRKQPSSTYVGTVHSTLKIACACSFMQQLVLCYIAVTELCIDVYCVISLLCFLYFVFSFSICQRLLSVLLLLVLFLREELSTNIIAIIINSASSQKRRFFFVINFNSFSFVCWFLFWSATTVEFFLWPWLSHSDWDHREPRNITPDNYHQNNAVVR